MIDSSLPDGSVDGPSGGRTPRWYTPRSFAAQLKEVEGLALHDLDPGATLVIRTKASEYRLVIVDGPRHRVLAVGGRFLPEAVEATVQGSSAGGSLLKIGWIGLGLRLELLAGGRRIVTSRVLSIGFERSPQPATRFRLAG